eukprot:scaffold4606_cov21-Tisochrysis_lutea.AAC.1
MASSAASLFLKTLLQILKQECVAAHGDAEGMVVWQSWWTGPLMAALTSCAYIGGSWESRGHGHVSGQMDRHVSEV